MILALIFGVIAGLFARRKGYWFLAYFLTGLIGCIIIAFLPNTNSPDQPKTPEELVRLRKTGNYVGLGVSFVMLIGGIVIGFLESSTSPH